MKTLALTLVLCATLLCSITAQSDKDIYSRWSILGDWNVTHPYWTHVVTFREDGTFATDDAATSGRWVLTADKGTPLLVLRWDSYGTESLLMVNQKHFRGQIQPGSFMDMRRGD
jgi:hypothetical protein